MAAVMQPPRPSMDRSASFDQPRRMHSPFASASSSSSAHYDHPVQRASSPISSTLSPYHASQPSLPSFPNSNNHSRNSSKASSVHKPSPYQQPYGNVHNSYFPAAQAHQHPQHMYPIQAQQSAWPTSAIPSTAFYSAPFQGYASNPVFHQGFQQSQGDFAAWASAYQHMMMASGAGANFASPHHAYAEMSAPHAEYLQEERRRVNTESRQSTSRASFEPAPAQPPSRPLSQAELNTPAASQQGGFHPYKRAPGHRSSRENIHAAMPRSSSQPALSTLAVPSSQADHRRSSSTESSASKESRPQRQSESSERGRDYQPQVTRTESPKPRVTPTPAASTTPAVPLASTPTIKAVIPLQAGPIANAINTPTASRSSPLAQTPVASSPEPEKKGLKGRLRKALTSDSIARKASVPPPTSPAKPAGPPQVFASPSETSTRSATPPITPPQHHDDGLPLSAPNAPFTVIHQNRMNSEVSLAETARTATTAQTDFGGPSKEKKKSLFRMKNMSTDNISLSSTVSSASMMIRKMGSLGKLARRNSLAGISKIFKERPKDEDGPLPEKEAKKKDKKDKKNKKGAVVPATVSHATAELDRTSVEDDDRALAGLSPAAKLARQHTLRSKAEAELAKKDGQSIPGTGEPTWDNNTTTRTAGGGPPQLPSIESLTNLSSSIFSSPTPTPTPTSPGGTPSSLGPEVLRVQPRHTQTVHHAHAVNVNVAEHEYDSDADDSSASASEAEAEDEDLAVAMGQTRVSEDTTTTHDHERDEEFKARWGNTWIDRNAVPKKGILKHAASFTEGANYRLRSQSTADNSFSGLTLSHPIPSTGHPGLTRDPNSLSSMVDFDSSSLTGTRFNLNFQPPASPGSLYANPAQNTSAPSLSVLATPPKPPVANRSMTVPARKRLNWAPECAVYSTYDAGTYDRRSEVATCNRLTPELAMAIKQELNAFKMEMPVHPASKTNTHYFMW